MTTTIAWGDGYATLVHSPDPDDETSGEAEELADEFWPAGADEPPVNRSKSTARTMWNDAAPHRCPPAGATDNGLQRALPGRGRIVQTTQPAAGAPATEFAARVHKR